MLRRIICVTVAALIGLTLTVTPASAAKRTDYYLALGDSLAFGFQPTPDHDFTHGYVQQLSATLPNLVLDNLGCPGETSTSLVLGGKCPYPGGRSQLDTAIAFLRAHRGKVRLITLDIGGNDGDHCVTAPRIEPTFLDQGALRIPGNLSRTRARLPARAPDSERG